MEGKSNHSLEKSQQLIDSLNNIPLISIMEKASIPWAIKDNQSRFVYLNDACLDLFNIQYGFDFEGRLDEEMPCQWSEFSEDFKAHDRKAEQSRDGAEIITTSTFGKEQIMSPWYFPKFPIYGKQGEVLGTLFYGKKFNFISVYDFFKNLKPSVISLNPPVDGFSIRSLYITFFALQNLTSNDLVENIHL
ncbi:helix-turn-helix transcriptional regulator, partial [Erwinia sp. OLTSP20]|uniref:PAS domain-containing protein n=1 Tax=Erwinia sp. OLTSP20 TaxID=1912857 RepID=UPI000C178FCD